MWIIPVVSIIFLAISVIFLIASFRDFIKSGKEMTIARRIWLRMALIFALAATGLYILHTYKH